jgi:tyrosyl-DNA phosphodiesterase-1
METPDDGLGPPCPKRRRLDNGDEAEADTRLTHPTLTQPVSPPPRRAKVVKSQSSTPFSAQSPAAGSPSSTPRVDVIPSPFQLTSIKDLPASLNVDSVSLGAYVLIYLLVLYRLKQ